MIKTPTGKISTSRNALLKIKHNIFIDTLLRYRELHKIINTYLVPMRDNLDASNRIHAMFSQSRTLTGRLSSSNPINFQNIPSRSELGKQVRKLFIGQNLIVADMNQIELRILAHFSKDENLIKAYKENIDVHNQTAKYIFKTDCPTKDQRFIAKVCNFSLIYGAGCRTLANAINSSSLNFKVSIEDAQRFIDSFNSLYTQFKNWKTVEIQKTKFLPSPYVVTLLGRSIPVQGIKESNFSTLYRAEREVISYKIQGSAADILKKSILDLTERIPNIILVSSIHDELIIDEGSEDMLNVVKDCMENSVQRCVPLVVEAKIVSCWGEK
ncbi:MAG: DNA polymerase A family protein [Nanoarchaeota archaeon]